MLKNSKNNCVKKFLLPTPCRKTTQINLQNFNVKKHQSVVIYLNRSYSWNSLSAKIPPYFNIQSAMWSMKMEEDEAEKAFKDLD